MSNILEAYTHRDWMCPQLLKLLTDAASHTFIGFCVGSNPIHEVQAEDRVEDSRMHAQGFMYTEASGSHSASKLQTSRNINGAPSWMRTRVCSLVRPRRLCFAVLTPRSLPLSMVLSSGRCHQALCMSF